MSLKPAVPLEDFRPCVLIPVYNHGSLIGATLSRLRKFELPCLMIDDGSDPQTAKVLADYAAEETWLSLVRLELNQGKGAAVLHGISHARRLGYTHALQLDADGQHNLEDIPALLAISRAEPEALVSATPVYDHTIPRARLYGRYVTHFCVWVETLSFSIVDSMCGFRVYPVVASDDLAHSRRIGQRMDFDTDIMVRLYWRGIPVRFLPSKVVYPANGISHFEPLADNVRITWMHTKLICGMFLRIPRLLRKKRPARPAGLTSHWSQIRESGAYGGMFLGVWCYRLLGRRALGLLLYPIMGYFFLTNSQARAASKHFLGRVYGHQLTPAGNLEGRTPYFSRPPALSDSFSHFMQFGRSIVDRVGSWVGDIDRGEAVFSGREQLLGCMEAGRGGVLLTSHLGNTEMFRALKKDASGIKINVLVFNDNARHINRLMKRLNPRADLELIQISSVGPGTAILLNEKLANGEFIVIAADRTSPVAPGKSMQAPFLGEAASFPEGPFVLAGLLACPVFLLFCLEQGAPHFYLEHFADELPIPRRERAKLLQQYITRYAQRLEHYTLAAPLQWFNFFDFWAVHEQPAAKREHLK